MARRDNQQQLARRTPRHVLTAAATRLTMDPGRFNRPVRLQEWQAEGWAFYGSNQPELKHAVQFTGNAMAKLVLYAAVYPKGAEADADPVPVDDEKSDLPEVLRTAAKAEVARLSTGVGGQPGLSRALNMNLEIAAECYLVGIGARPSDNPVLPDRPESWNIRSISEITYRDGRWYVKSDPSDTQGTELDLSRPADGYVGRDALIRIYQPHPQWQGLADGHMAGNLGELRILEMLSNQVLAEALSAMPAEIILMPSELSFGPPEPTEPEGGDEASDPFLDEFDRSLHETIEDPLSFGTVRGMVVRGPAEYLKPEVFRTISLKRGGEGILEDRIEKHVTRFARGSNLPVEVVMGHQATTYANAEQVDQDTFEDYLQGRANLGVDALTIGFLRPNLLDAYPGMAEDIARCCIWYDPSALIGQPNVEQNAPQAHQLNLISDQAARRSLGFNEEDAPDALELVIRAGLRRGILTAELTAALLQQLADEAGVELPDPAMLAPGAGGGGRQASNGDQMRMLAQLLLLAQQGETSSTPELAPAPAAITATARPVSHLGMRLMTVDRDLRTRLLILADATMSRALDKAGARLRSRAGTTRDVLRQVPNRLAASTLGRALVAQAGFAEDELLTDTLAGMESQFMAWGAQAQAQALELAGTAVAGFTVAERDILQLRQAGDLAEAWQWMLQALTGLGTNLLYDPSPLAPELGELDATLAVPAGLIRAAVSIAGGGAGLSTAPVTGGHSAWVTLTDGGTRPAGGIGTGEVVREVLRTGGAATEGYQWVYGPAARTRPFEPHQQLDGVTFVNFDDPVLANDGGFPEFAYYLPGDHAGCICDVAPIIIQADELT